MESLVESTSEESKSLGGLTVDQGKSLDPEEIADARIPGKLIAVAKRGQEAVFGHLNLSPVIPVSAADADEAMAHARRYLKRAGITRNFLSFDLTTHFYLAPLGKRVCGWSFTFREGTGTAFGRA